MNQHLPVLKPRDLLRALGRAGFFIHHTSGSHYILKHPDHPRARITLPYHNKDIKGDRPLPRPNGGRPR